MNQDQGPLHQRPTSLQTFLFGAPYYPEHWTEAEREQDAERMAAAGVNVVRMGEFAWDRFEPRPGEFDFSLFDEVIGRLGRQGIRTVLCTPTATPPRWLTRLHPDWMRVDASGRAMVHGSRQHVCTTNRGFQAESRRITRVLAQHYAGNPNVIGWQTDNEFNCHFSECFCPACEAAFQGWLAERYNGRIDDLNRRWGTAFWALTYSSFDEIPLPHPENRPAFPNPSAELDYDRFISDTVVAFQAQQVRILREANPDWWVTHNGLFPHIDYLELGRDLDFLGVDVYPGFSALRAEDYVWAAWKNETCRAVSGSYVVPEQQGGPGGQKPYSHHNPQPGQMRLWAYQSIAHGADGMLHFRWRTCRFGAETYWCGILDHDNVPRRRYREFSQEGRELKALGPRLLGTVLDVEAAVLIESEQDEAHRTLSMGLPSPTDVGWACYAELLRRHLPCGLVDARDSLAGLRLVVLPSFPLMDPGLCERLRAFVEGGGVLVVTARSAVRDRDNQAPAGVTPPWLLSELTGARVAEFGRLEPGAVCLADAREGEKPVPAGAGYEVLELDPGTEAVARWLPFEDGRPFAAAGAPAISRRCLGKGTVFQVGTFVDAGNVAAVLAPALAVAGLRPLAEAEPVVEVTRRRSADRVFAFVLNHDHRPQRVTGLGVGTEALTETPITDQIELPGWGVAVVEGR